VTLQRDKVRWVNAGGDCVIELRFRVKVIMRKVEP
jgi:hypothetical protein